MKISLLLVLAVAGVCLGHPILEDESLLLSIADDDNNVEDVLETLLMADDEGKDEEPNEILRLLLAADDINDYESDDLSLMVSLADDASEDDDLTDIALFL